MDNEPVRKGAAPAHEIRKAHGLSHFDLRCRSCGYEWQATSCIDPCPDCGKLPGTPQEQLDKALAEWKEHAKPQVRWFHVYRMRGRAGHHLRLGACLFEYRIPVQGQSPNELGDGWEYLDTVRLEIVP